MKQYKVIWFDDEHESFEIRKEQARQKGIILFGYNNAEDGIAELDTNFLFYDAAIVDGKFYKSSRNTGDTVNNLALSSVARFLDRLENKKKIPWFILSGQMEFVSGINDIAIEYKNNKVYNKNFTEDYDQLWQDIINEADKQPETQIKHNYSRVFEVCTDKYIGEQGSNHLLAILKKENHENAFSDPEIYFNPLRKIMDDLFIAFNKYGFIPDVFIKPSVALNESSRFLSGSVEKGYQLNQIIFPKVISDNVRNILTVCQPASHRSEIDSFVSQVNSPYLLLSVTYQLLDVMLWFKIYIDNNNNIELNKTFYKMVETSIDSKVIIGTIEKDEKDNYHCDKIVLTYKIINENNYQIGDEIRILKTANNSNKNTMSLYPLSALQTEKI
jgi:hypothetical protein